MEKVSFFPLAGDITGRRKRIVTDDIYLHVFVLLFAYLYNGFKNKMIWPRVPVPVLLSDTGTPGNLPG